jgi:hypothetical protein
VLVLKTRMVSYKLNPFDAPMVVGYIVSVELRAYFVTALRLCGLFGLGIINMALDGPTKEMRRMRAGIARANNHFRHPRIAGDLNIDM